MVEPGHETFEHIADVGIRGWGGTPEEAFVGGAKAMMGVMFDTSTVERKKVIEVECSADDLGALFVEWLNALLTQRDLEEMVFSDFEVRIEEGGEEKTLKGKALGEGYDPERHEFRTEVKAATYSQLKVYHDEQKKMYVAQCIVDV